MKPKLLAMGGPNQRIGIEGEAHFKTAFEASGIPISEEFTASSGCAARLCRSHLHRMELSGADVSNRWPYPRWVAKA